jgi:hypothetical protein
MLNLKLLEKEEQAIPQKSRRREIMKMIPEINEIETNKKKHMQRINETRRWLFE